MSGIGRLENGLPSFFVELAWLMLNSNSAPSAKLEIKVSPSNNRQILKLRGLEVMEKVFVVFFETGIGEWHSKVPVEAFSNQEASEVFVAAQTEKLSARSRFFINGIAYAVDKTSQFYVIEVPFRI